MRKNDSVNPKTSSLKAIAEFFNISIDQLLGLQALSKDKEKGVHTAVSYTAALLPIIDWTDVTNFVKDPGEFSKGKVLKWISSTRDFSDHAYAIRILDNDRALFLKEDSIILIEPLKKLKRNGIALFSNSDNQIDLYQVILDGKDVYIKSTDPEIKGLKLLPNNLTLLGGIAEIRYSFQEENADSFDKAKNIFPFNILEIT